MIFLKIWLKYFSSSWAITVFDYAIQFACMAIVAIPSLIIYLALNKYITQGVTADPVKG